MRLSRFEHRPCTVEEIEALREYHRTHSHVAPVVLALIERQFPVLRANVNGADSIGQLKTFFGNIGRARCRDMHASDRFLVRQAADVLVCDDYRDDPDVTLMSERVARYKHLFNTATSDPKVTIVESTNDCLIVDGNKSAIAAFLHASEGQASNLNLPVYCVHAGGQIINWIL